MGIGRLLVLGLIIWLIWFLFNRLKSAKARLSHQTKKTKVANIRQCAVCAVHVPESEAVLKEGLFYCSQAHADKR